MKIKIGPPGGTLTNIAASNVELGSLTPFDSDLGQQIDTCSFVVDNEKQVVAVTPKVGLEVQVIDDDGSTVRFGGYLRSVTALPYPTVKGWKVDCQSYDVRTFECNTGALDKGGIIDIDRNFVIAIFRAGLKNVGFPAGTATISDAIIAANEPNWTGVRGTAVVSGSDFSYMPVKQAMDLMTGGIPHVHWSIDRATKLLNYGPLSTLAPYICYARTGANAPATATVQPFEGYSEQQLVGNHRNKMKRGGAAASTATAYDEVAFNKLGGLVLEDPYRNDSTVPSSDLTRRTYAELESKRILTVVNLVTRQKGLVAGQLLDVKSDRLGSGTKPAPFLMSFSSQIYGRSTTGLLAGERGRFLITKVRAIPRGNQQYEFDVQAGDYLRDFTTGIAALAGAGT